MARVQEEAVREFVALLQLLMNPEDRSGMNLRDPKAVMIMYQPWYCHSQQLGSGRGQGLSPVEWSFWGE